MTSSLHKIIGLVVLVFSFASFAETPSLSGKWRGEMVIRGEVSLTIGINIHEDTLTLDSPNQGMFNRAPTSFEIEGDTLSFTDKGLGASYLGKVSNGEIRGTFKQGRDFDLNFKKLTEKDLNRLAFEGTYSGELIINKRAKLPLNLNIAVLPDRYLATLDSPSQKSFGIPVSPISISHSELSFSSAMINASFKGTLEEAGYKGTFTQGMERPLTLTKQTNSLATPQASIKSTPKQVFGQFGGSYAIIDKGEIEEHFFADHSAETRYEIGSVTKTFVAYLLADLISTKQLMANEPLNQFFPKAPQSISLLQLATHTSGLARLPDNLFYTADMEDPYKHYDIVALEAALADHQHQHNQHLYSNYGYGVLAESLARFTKLSFEKMLDRVILQKLDMPNTFIAKSTSASENNLAKGHNFAGTISPHWHFDALAGAGALVSDLSDMTKYVGNLMLHAKDRSTISKVLFSKYVSISPCCEQGLSWILSKDHQGREYAWHNGQTAGFSSFVGFYLDGSRGVVLLNNQAIDINETAIELLTQQTS